MSNQEIAVPKQHPIILDRDSVKRIPSLELQTLAFMNMARAQGTSQEIRLSWNGFHVWLGFDPDSPIEDISTLKNVFTIIDVYAPIPYRFRGWFTHYLQLCQQWAGGTLLIFGAPAPKLHNSLLRQGFEQVTQQYWLIQE